MNVIDTVVIPAAGTGSRVKHLTHNTCKELLPYNGLPLIDHALIEAAKAGFKRVIVVSHPSKTNLNNYLKQYPSIEIVYQQNPLGLGDAILATQKLIKSDYFAVLLPDVICTHPVFEHLIPLCTRLNAPGFAVTPLSEALVPLAGIIDPVRLKPEYGRIRGIVEKPDEKAPSNLGIIGRYVLDGGIFDRIATRVYDKEVELTPNIRLDSVYWVYEHDFIDGGNRNTYE